MTEWIDSVLVGPAPSLAVIPAAFLVGVLGAFTSACNLALLAGIAAGSGSLAGEGDRRGVLVAGLGFLVGTVLALAVIGAVTGFVGAAAGATMGRYWTLAAGVLILVFGLVTLNLLPLKLPALRLSGRGRGGIAGSMVYGLALGGGTATCAIGCNPVLPMALGYATLQGTVGWGAAILAAFALGYGLPLAAAMVGLGLGFGRLTAVAQRATPVLRGVSGVVLIGVGITLLAVT